MRCFNCNEKFTPTNFLQKSCTNLVCQGKFRELQKSKAKVLDKPCKGSAESTKGFGCGKSSKNRKFGLGIDCKCYSNWLLNSDAGANHLKRVQIKVSGPRLELEKAIEDKKERIKLTHLLVNVRNICHEYIRTRDIGKPCISCGIQWQSDHQCGHFYKSELYSNLRFEEKNLNSQCKQCNLRKEGNESGYRVGIIQRFGKEVLEYLDNKAKDNKKNDFHWDRFDLEEIRKYYQDKIKTLKLLLNLKI